MKYAARFNFTLMVINTNDTDYGWLYRNWTGIGLLATLISDDSDFNDILYGGFPSWTKVDAIASARFIYEVSVPIPK